MQKQELLNWINNIRRVFTRNNDKTGLTKANALKDKLQAITFDKNTTGDKLGPLNTIREEMQLLQDAANTTGGEPINDFEIDDQFRERALKQMQQGLKQFERYLSSLDTKLKRLERQGVPIPKDLKDTLAKAKEMAARTKKAKTYDEIKDIIEEMPEMGEKLNEFLPRLEQLSRLPRAMKLIDKQLADARRLLKTATATVKRLKLDAAEQMAEMEKLVAQMADAVKSVKAGNYEGDDLFDYIQMNVIEPFADVQSISSNIAALANVKRYVSQLNTQVKRYDTLIKRAEKEDEDMTEAKDLLAELREHVKELTALAGKKLTPDLGEDILVHMDSIMDVRELLDSILGLEKPGAVERQLQRFLESGGEKFDRAKVGDLENLIVHGYRVANFWRMAPMKNFALIY